MEPDLRAPGHLRLAFRELGLAIGLAGVPILERDEFVRRLDPSARSSLAYLAYCLPLRAEIESFWLSPTQRRTSTWIAHADINDVMGVVPRSVES